MSIQGVQGGPDQIADGVDPSILGTVIKGQSGNSVQSLQELFSATGLVVPQQADAAGRMVLSDTDKLTAILVEMRIQTYYLSCLAAGVIANDDPDVLRADTDVSGLVNALS